MFILEAATEIVPTIPIYIPIILYVVGLFFACIEIFTPGFGLFGIIGILACIAGVVLRVIAGATALEIVLTLVAIVAVLIAVFLIMSRSAQKGRLSKSPLILSQNAVSTGHTEGTGDYSHLVGKEGVTTTFLRSIGKASVEDTTYDVIASDGEIIESGEIIKVISVEGQKIIVKKI